VSFSPDGKRLASSGKVWDSQTGEELLSLKGQPWLAGSLVFSPDGKRLISRGGPVAVWDAQTGKQLSPASGNTAASPSASNVAVSPDGKRLALATTDHVKLRDMQTGQDLLSIKVLGGLASTVAFSADGHRLGHATTSGTVTVWDATPLPEAGAK
jgi:WD40 repeat protein